MLGVPDEERPTVCVHEGHVRYRAVRERDGEMETQVVGERLELGTAESVRAADTAGAHRGRRGGQDEPPRLGDLSVVKSARKLSRVTGRETASPSRSPAIRCLSNRRSYSVTSKVS